MVVWMRLRMRFRVFLRVWSRTRLRSRTRLWSWSCLRSRFRRWPLWCWPLLRRWSGLWFWFLRPRLLFRSRWRWLGFGLWLHGVFRSVFRSIWPGFHRIAGLRRHGVRRPCFHGVGRSWAGIDHRAHDRSGSNSVVRCDWLRRSKRLGSSMVNRGELCAVRRRFPLQLELPAHRRCMRCAICRYLSGNRAKLNSLRPSVIAHPVVVVDRDVVDDRSVVDVGDVNVADVVDRVVVVEIVAVPVAALIAPASVAVAVVHATIEADITAPVPVVEAVSTAIESPIGRRP